MLFEPTDVNIEFVKRGQELAKRAILSELCKGIDILREALSAVAALSVGAWNVIYKYAWHTCGLRPTPYALRPTPYPLLPTPKQAGG